MAARPELRNLKNTKKRGEGGITKGGMELPKQKYVEVNKGQKDNMNINCPST
jgi:hypothetical protein